MQAHPADSTLALKDIPIQREELAKIKISNIKKVSKAHLQHKPEAANEPFTIPLLNQIKSQ